MKKLSVLISGVIVWALTLGIGVNGTPWVSAHVNEDIETSHVQERYKPGEMIIGFIPGLTEEEVEDFYDEFYESFGLKKKKDLDRNKKGEDRAQKLAEAPEVLADDLMTLLMADPRVEYVEPNYMYVDQVIPNDVRFTELWGLHNTGQTGGTVDIDVDAPEAWDNTVNIQEVLVAIIDTGIDFSHEDLAGNMWVNPNEIPGNGIDDDGNGYVDDMHGINAITGSGNPFDDNGHGTHVAGTIAAVRGNSVGVSGVSHNARIIACKFLNSIGSGTAADATECIKYVNHLKNVLGQNIVITNNSWGGSGAGSQAIRDAFAGLDQPGMSPILHVTAAGNNSTNIEVLPFFPASFPLNNILAVAAIDHNDRYGTFSNFGNISVDVAAPGVNILSTVPNFVCQLCDPTGYRLLDGTSMASPHVAGIAALVWGQEPTMTANAVKERLISTVNPLSDLSKRTTTNGRVNALRALPNGVGPVAPAITSAPGTTSTVDQLYTYQPQASGTAPLTWSLITGPVGMNINPGTGFVTWMPSTDGNFTVTLETRNAAGSDTQSFTINVVGVLPPTILSTPEITGIVGQTYTYQANATGTQPITWSLVSGPVGMTIGTNNGLLRWVPGTVGNHPVQLQASNVAGSNSQTYTITVTATPPTVENFSAGPNSIVAGGTSTLTWATTGADTVSIDNAVGENLPPNGGIQVAPGTTTTYRLTASGAGGTTTSTVRVTVTVNNNTPPRGSISLSGPSSIERGDRTLYTVTFTNTGNSTITGVQLTLTLPGNRMFRNVSPGNSVIVGNVAPGTSVSQTWNVRGGREGSGTVTAGASTGETILDSTTQSIRVID